MEKKKSFILNTLAFSAATFISRILGYLRDATIAYFFGANPLTDAFFIAWKLPNTFRQLLGEGSFNAAFIPIYTDEKKKNPQSVYQFVSSVFTYYTLTLIVLTLLAIVFAEGLITILAPGFLKNKEVFNEAVKLVRIVFPYLILAGWVSFFMALLNTKNRFFLPAFTPALLNLSFITSAFLMADKLGIYSLAIGALIGGLIQVLVLVPYIKKENFKIGITFKIHPRLKEFLKKMVPAFISFGVSQFSFIVDTVIASFLLGGAISYLYYANRIFQLPMGVFAIGLGNALLVSLSKHYTEKNINEFNKDFNRGIVFSLLIATPATVGMIVLGKEIIELLLVRGQFTPEDAVMTNYALIGYSLGLVGYALSRPFKSAIFSIGDTKTPLYATIFGVIIGIISAIIFGFVFKWGVFGLAFASSLAGIGTTLYLYIKSKSKFYIDLKLILKSFFKILVSAILMGLVVLLIKNFIPILALKVFLSIFIAVFVYFGILTILKEETAQIFINKIKRKFGRK